LNIGIAQSQPASKRDVDISAGSAPDRPPSDCTTSELRGSFWSGLFTYLYQILGCNRRWRVARPLMALVLRFEGGGMTSRSARELLRKHHGIEVGAWSYGPFFDPGTFPPKVSIGRYVSMATSVRVMNENHPRDHLSTHPKFYEQGNDREQLIIESDVWIGHNATILPGCRHIGLGAIVGAGSVVTRNVPAFAVVAGVPARIIRSRFPIDIQNKIVASRWWELSLSQLEAILSDEITKPTSDNMLRLLEVASEKYSLHQS
jgi:virginiamycin A acetyltransferase